MPRKVLPYVLAILVIVAGAVAWWLVNRAITMTDASILLIPAIAVSVYAILLALFFALVREGVFVTITSLLSVGASLLFSPSIYHLPAVLVGFFLLLWARENMFGDIHSSVRVHFGRSVARGFSPVVMAVALLVSSQYFVAALAFPSDRLIPRIEKNRLTDSILSWALGRISPQFKAVDGAGLTVDEVLKEIQVATMDTVSVSGVAPDAAQTSEIIEAQLGEQFTAAQKAQLRGVIQGIYGQADAKTQEMTKEQERLFLIIWKQQLSDMVGFEVTGSEKAGDVLVSVINARISKIFETTPALSSRSPFLPSVVALALFVTLASLGSFLKYLWGWGAHVIFWLLRVTRVIKISLAPKEAQEIEY